MPSLFRPLFGAICAAFVSTCLAAAQQPVNRIPRQIEGGASVALPGSVSPRVHAAHDLGPMDASAPIQGMTLWFQPTARQKADLDALVQAQQTAGSPLYHAWLTPEQYGSRFGLSDADLAQVENWLESQGFNVDEVSNSRTSITFSGTAAQVASAFQTELHRYQLGSETHFANANEVAIPAALTGIVRSVGNLNDFRPSPQFRPSPESLQPSFTSSQSGGHFLTPKDIATIYDINAAWNAGYTGSGETIAVVGQSQIAVADIEAFQSAAGMTVKDPKIVLVPNSGTSTVVSGDEAESDLDLEYSSGTAPGASIDFIYVGNNKNYSTFDALNYAVQHNVAPIISISYGLCEPDLGSAAYSKLEGIMQQAASQGQTVVAASGDAGSTACYDPTNNTVTPAMQAIAVNYPASSAYAVGVGGTEFPIADVASGNTVYWKSASGNDLVNSALSYIPEQTWNDDSAAAGQQSAQYALSSGGGGISTLTARPSWQTGVTGIPSGGFRLVPDVSLASSPNNAPYLYCTSDQSSWSKGQKASCNSGFRDAATQNLTIAGGTSFAAPIFAGMLAILEQRQNSSGLGIANKTLYALAANPSTYASAFHDVAIGGNECSAGAPFCSSTGSAQYFAGIGYDEATGLGSVDLNNLMAAWAGSSGGTGGGGGGGTGSASFALAATNVTVTHGSSATSTITAQSQNSYAGTIGFSVSSTSSVLNTNGCYTINNATVAAGASATAILTVYTSHTSCSGLSGARSFAQPRTGSAAARKDSPFGNSLPTGAAAFACVLLFGFGRLRRSSALMSCFFLVAMLGLVTGCGNTAGNTTTATSTTSAGTDVPVGTYTVTVAGTDTTTSGLTASTSLTLTVN